MRPPSCLCGCGEDLNPNTRSRFRMGHDARADGRLKRLSSDRQEVRLEAGDEDVLAPTLLDFYRQNPDFHVVRKGANVWNTQRIVDLAQRLGRD